MLFTLPAYTQVKADNTTPVKRTTRLENAIERAVAAQQQVQQQAQKTPNRQATSFNDDELTPSEIIDAETELQSIRDHSDPSASFRQYPYLLDPAYRRRNDNTACNCRKTSPAIVDQEPLSTQELIEAEEELQHLRNVKDANASFETYPYLLAPNYRRGSAEVRQKVLREFRKSHSTWARKVGI